MITPPNLPELQSYGFAHLPHSIILARSSGKPKRFHFTLEGLLLSTVDCMVEVSKEHPRV